MKKLEKIKLNQLSSVELNEREMCQLLGGDGCQCGCNYAYSGGSSSSDNSSANDAGGGLTSDPQENCGCQTDCDCQTQPAEFCETDPEPQSTLCGSTQPTCWI